MTVGAFALIVMGTAPHTPAVPLAAINPAVNDGPTQVICETDVILRIGNWNNIVVNVVPTLDDQAIQDSHFVIVQSSDGSGEILQSSTPLWRKQKSGTQVYSLGSTFNDEAIGVCLVGDFASREVSQEEFDSLMYFVRSLQRHFQVPSERVYLPQTVDASRKTPAGFPANAFHRYLLP